MADITLSKRRDRVRRAKSTHVTFSGYLSTRVTKKPVQYTLNYFKRSQLINHGSNVKTFAIESVEKIVLRNTFTESFQ